MPSWIRALTKKYLNNSLTIDLVGDSDQKLADGITMFSITADSYGRASIIAPLVTVCFLYFALKLILVC
ncbi:DEAD-box ATP-dependent RNA helicase 9 [Cardamine amara subsp. amara]|uniref:DEAD-box ATP-dependent RNA helicase 9 n=1 Tax=Cardamine amara subsp. amara TaxID=228776 RepID=A0ABD1AN97_CARAN